MDVGVQINVRNEILLRVRFVRKAFLCPKEKLRKVTPSDNIC